MDRKTRNLSNIYGMVQSLTDIDRLYDPRKNGGSGLRQIETYNAETTRNAYYIDGKANEDHVLSVKVHEDKKSLETSAKKRGRKLEKDSHATQKQIQRRN